MKEKSGNNKKKSSLNTDNTASEDKKAAESKDKNKKNTSLRLDKATLKALKIKAIENDTSIQKLIESLIQDYLKNS